MEPLMTTICITFFFPYQESESILSILKSPTKYKVVVGFFFSWLKTGSVIAIKRELLIAPKNYFQSCV